MTFVDRIARIRIELEGIAPAIWPRVDVPLTTSLRGLHEVIQAVMMFENYHLFQFDIARNGTVSPTQNGIINSRRLKPRTSNSVL